MISCCIIGHRTVEGLDVDKLRGFVDMLINKGVRIFNFGTRSVFNEICYQIISEVREKYNLKLVCYVCKSEMAFTKQTERLRVVCAELNHINVEEIPLYDEEKRPEVTFNSGKNSYLERNKVMIDESDFCLFYYNEEYLPNRRKRYKRALSTYQPKSGTRLAYEYAVKRKGKENIFNVYKKSEK